MDEQPWLDFNPCLMKQFCQLGDLAVFLFGGFLLKGVLKMCRHSVTILQKVV